MMKVDCIVNHGCSLGESPVWSQAAGAVYWLDVAVPSTLFEWSARTGAPRSWPLDELASALTLSQDAAPIVISQAGVRAFDPARGALRTIAAPPFSMQHIRFNDCGCDPAGRLWTGTMVNNFEKIDAGAAGNAATDSLYRIDPNLTCHLMARGFSCPNTFAWSLDGRTLYVADSAAGCIYACRYDLAAGTIADWRVFANPERLGVPDGSAVDSEGCIWNARWGAGCVARFAPDGSVMETVPIPTKLVTSCAFGGEALDTLFVTTASCDLSAQERAQQPLAGGLFAFKPGVSGVPAGRFRVQT